MPHPMLGMALLVVVLTFVSCGEKPSRVQTAKQDAALPAGGASDPLRERALSPSESSRIYY